MKKVEKWPKNHYLATLGIYLQFHDFQSFSKKITEKILTAGFYNWWYQYIRKFKYFPNNIPKNISGGVKQLKNLKTPYFFYFFWIFFNETSERGSPRPELVMNEYLGYIYVILFLFLNTSVPFFPKLNKNWPIYDFFSLNSVASNSAQSFMIFKVFLKNYWENTYSLIF